MSHYQHSVVTAYPSHDPVAVNRTIWYTAALTSYKGRPRKLRSKAMQPRSDLVLGDTL